MIELLKLRKKMGPTRSRYYEKLAERLSRKDGEACLAFAQKLRLLFVENENMKNTYRGGGCNESIK